MTAEETVNYYAILGIARSADQPAIKRAFHKLARRYHPDQSTEPGAQERFKKIAEAYAILSDPDQRADYDRIGGGLSRGGFSSSTPGAAGPDLGDAFAPFGGRATPVSDEDTGWFGRLFGEPGWRGTARADDLELILTVPLATILTGSTETVTIPRPGPCPACAPSGSRDMRTGDCEVCGGSGECDVDEDVTLTIPRGLYEGAMLPLPGCGYRAPAGGVDGDARISVRTEPDPRFTRRGAELWHEKWISVPDAVLGTTLTVPAVDGEAPLVVPPGTQPGAVLRIPDRGLPHPDGQGRADLVVKLAVHIPRQPDGRERRLYRRLRRLARSR